jgi:Type VI secretion system/phage-baseplate injector OB domain
MSDTEMNSLLVELAETSRSRFYGKYRGVVKSIETDQNLCRIVALVPEVYGDKVESPPAYPCAPFAGKDHGLVLIPEEGDGVWIEFEAGDPSRPIWSGGWWGDDELPDPAGPKARTLATTTGHKIVLDDDGSEIQVLHSGGAEMKMTDDDITLSIGQTETKMTSDEITLKIGTTEIKLSSAEIVLKSGPAAQVKISASGVDINNGAMKVM